MAMSYLMTCHPESVGSTRQVASQAKMWLLNMTKSGHPVAPSCWPVESAIVEARVFVKGGQTKKWEYRASQDD